MEDVKTVDIDLTEFDNRTADQYVVNCRTDNSGDYEYRSYDILAVTKWGTRTICTDIENPVDANMFSKAPELIKELKRCRELITKLETKLSVIKLEVSSSDIQHLE